MAEDILRHLLAPSHLLLCLERVTHLFQEVYEVVVGQVAIRHIGVEELHRLTLPDSEGVHTREEDLAAPLSQLSAVQVILVHLSTVVLVANKMFFLATARRHHKAHADSKQDKEKIYTSHNDKTFSLGVGAVGAV